MSSFNILQNFNPDENLLLYINISGELFYIINHRLKNQEVDLNVINIVEDQLLLSICSPNVINSLTNGNWKILSNSLDQLRAHVGDIVDGTIMKINEYSKQKLFELTLIATKFQYTVCSTSFDILLIALNHLDSLRKYAKDSQTIQLLVALHHLLIQGYAKRSITEMRRFRFAILKYLGNIRLKMTNLLNLGLQNENGDFIRPTETSQGILTPSDSEKLSSKNFYSYVEEDSDEDAGFQEDENLPKSSNTQLKQRRMHSLELNGDRVITLGLSIYELQAKKNTHQVPKGKPSIKEKEEQADFQDISVVQDLDLFNSFLLGSTSSISSNPPTSKQPITTQRFSTNDLTKNDCNNGLQTIEGMKEDNFKTTTIHSDSTAMIRIDASSSHCSQPLKNILSDFDLKSESNINSNFQKPSLAQLMDKIFLEEE